MTNKMYRKGTRFESQIKRGLELQGFYVMASKGSKGVFDLIAQKPLMLLNMQLKTGKRALLSDRTAMYIVTRRTLIESKSVLIELDKKGKLHVSITEAGARGWFTLSEITEIVTKALRLAREEANERRTRKRNS